MRRQALTLALLAPLLLGASKPQIPNYPPDHPVAKLDRKKK